MKRGRLFFMAPTVWILCTALVISCVIMWFIEPIVAYIELGVVLVLVAAIVYRLFHDQKDIDRYMKRVLKHIDESDEQSLTTTPLPIAVIDHNGQIVWHNARFENDVNNGQSCIGKEAQIILPHVDLSLLSKTSTLETAIHDKYYRVYVSPLSVRGRDLYVLYCLDISHLHSTALEYEATRPVVCLIQIDNLDELMQRLRDSERGNIESKVENALENWLSSTTAILRKIDDDRFFSIMEKRFLLSMIDSRFDILDTVKTISVDNNLQITLSIGVGEGNDFLSAQNAAKSALEMALGRGGDQVALRTPNGFEFYGGQSKGVEKRTKVRTRVMASALRDLIESADNVIVMGHRYSDLDCIGSSATLVSVCRMLGKSAYVAVSRDTSLAQELISRYIKAGKEDYFIEPDEALLKVQPKTLLIITDTQIPHMLESFPLYERIQTVAIIDHHRKSASSCDKSVLFYHESFASSACEMVAELIQYLDVSDISVLDAEALLSGIMLDTRNFVLKAGVRTFEAAAYLRKLGADTVSVKTIFAGSMDMYRQKSDIISSATFYKRTAIAAASDGNGSELRIASAQAADEMLMIVNTDAAFTLYKDGGTVNISARSYGACNVQLVMEYLGGGGHLTMAGVQLKEISIEEAIVLLKKAIDRYWIENPR